VLRLPCCSGHNIIPTTHRRNEPFIAALLGCCFLSQANTTSSCLPPPPPAAFSPLPFRASLFLLLATHIPNIYIYIYIYINKQTCVALRYIALHCVYVPRWCTRVAPLHLRPQLHALAARRVSRKFRGNQLTAVNYTASSLLVATRSSRTIVVAGETVRRDG